MVPGILTNVFFWATVATATLYIEVAVFTSRREYARRTYAIAGILAVLGFGLPRALIPFLPQPTLGVPTPISMALGGALFLLGAGIILRSWVRLRRASAERASVAEEARRQVIDDGIYGIVRHPMYLGDVLWGLGLAVALDATFAIALTPLWWVLRLSLSILEEERLVDKHGDAYREYRNRVQNRILPLRW
ncbi:MAG: isoprenylcysteine carboxylmethyltransferase family protein [Halodesulfurarchaeum sp.]